MYAPHYYDDGSLVPMEDFKTPVSCDFLRKLYLKGEVAKHGEFVEKGMAAERTDHYRAQEPIVVTLPIMPHEFAITPIYREYVLYSKNGRIGSAGAAAMSLWNKWEKDDTEAEYPKIDTVDGELTAIVCEQIDDGDFDELWREVKCRKHRCAGDPERPFAFTCLEPDYKLYRISDPAKGINY